MRALITNDDGIGTTGIHTLGRVAVAAGLDVTLAAPHQERSGSSAALSALEEDGRLAIENRSLDGLGPNTGMAVLHSGTVGAALTAASQGLPALAVSSASAHPTYWETAAAAATRGLRWFLAHLSQPYVLNVNVPDVPPDQLRGLHRAELASFGAVQANIGGRNRGYVTMTFEEIDDEPAPDTDVALLRRGWASATALQPPGICDTIDLASVS